MVLGSRLGWWFHIALPHLLIRSCRIINTSISTDFASWRELALSSVVILTTSVACLLMATINHRTKTQKIRLFQNALIAWEWGRTVAMRWGQFEIPSLLLVQARVDTIVEKKSRRINVKLITSQMHILTLWYTNVYIFGHAFSWIATISRNAS